MISVGPPQPNGLTTYLTYHGSTRLMAAAGGHRYVAIWIDSEWRADRRQTRRVALLGHELQHAVEISREPDVVDQTSMISLFERIGRETAHNRFETDAALFVESRVAREFSAADPRPSTTVTSLALPRPR